MKRSIVLASPGDAAALAELNGAVRDFYPDFRVGHADVSGRTTLGDDRAAIYFWVVGKSGRVFLPAGYRTHEGDGDPLPDGYQAERLPPAASEALDFLEAHRGKWPEKLQVPLGRILGRRRNAEVFCGSYPADADFLRRNSADWVALPFAPAIQTMLDLVETLGASVKKAGSWEPLSTGDQLAIAPGQRVEVEGPSAYWYLADASGALPNCSLARRIRYVVDTSGGCNVSPSAFRRLLLTWDGGGCTADRPDGRNRVNSHIVNMAADTALTHYHPIEPRSTLPAGAPTRGPAMPQCEMYLSLDPSDLGIRAWSDHAHAIVFPDVDDLSRFQRQAIGPNQFAFIPPGVGHRGMDLLANVIALPGFKPNNELALDQAIKDSGADAPFNARFVK